MEDYLDCIFAKLQLAFCKRYRKVHDDEQVYLQLKNMEEKNERVEVYYERSLKLANNLQHETIIATLALGS
jgi:hypothetical protein